MTQLQVIANAIVAVVILIAYAVLTGLHDDGSALLGLLGGQGLSVALNLGAKAASNGAG